MQSILSIKNLNKIYKNGFHALKDINLDIQLGEIFALLGPNGAGKTTLINSICGITTPTRGEITVAGFNNITQYKEARKQIGLVPQEIPNTAFEKVIDLVNFSRGIFGLPPDKQYTEQLLKELSLYDKRKNKMLMLSGGMKRRLMIAKALAHRPQILFLDEPTAGVDVKLRQAMWQQVQNLRNHGVTIILTTHYIEEAQVMADRVGIINQGKITFVEKKDILMQRLGKKEIHLTVKNAPIKIPTSLNNLNLTWTEDKIIYRYATYQQENAINRILKELQLLNVEIIDIHTKESSLEDIFRELTK